MTSCAERVHGLSPVTRRRSFDRPTVQVSEQLPHYHAQSITQFISSYPYYSTQSDTMDNVRDVHLNRMLENR